MPGMGSYLYVPDVNSVGVRVADGEVALERERNDHEDGRGHEDLQRGRALSRMPVHRMP